MLTMSFVYFNIWQIKQTEPGDFAKAMIGFNKDLEKNLLEATSPFVFSTVNERSILRLLKLIACDNGKVGSHPYAARGTESRTCTRRLTQCVIVEIEAEQALVAANRELITRFEQKIQATLARVWDE